MKRVWVTRDEPLGGELSNALGQAGLDPVLEPVVERRSGSAPSRSPSPGRPGADPRTSFPRAFDRFVARTVQAVAVTSPDEADAVASISGVPPCASIGPETSAALRRHGIEPWLESREPTFESLSAAIAAGLKSSDPA